MSRLPRCRSAARLAAALALLAWAGCTGAVDPPEAGRVLGATERVRVLDADLDFLAIVDTGAHRSSIHALELEVADAAPDMRDDVGKRVEFRVVNEAGRSRRVAATISDVALVRTSHGSEPRYIVPLRLRWRDVEREVHVNLHDRTPMTYKLLLGRDWIQQGFVVDVRRNAVD